MADKYLIHGAAFCGNGLASNEAASAGASGAWNNINVLQGTAPAQGSLASGDRVIIRSKTSGGADVDVALSASVTFGSTAATEANPIDWLFDNGVTWPGVSGTVRYTLSGGSYSFTQRNYNNLLARDGNFSWVQTYASYGNSVVVNTGNAVIEGLFVDLSAFTGGSGGYFQMEAGVLRNLYVKARRRYRGIFAFGSGRVTVFYNLQVELLDATQTAAVFNLDYSYGSDVTVFGGRIFGAGAAEGVPLCISESNACSATFYNFNFPRVMPLGRTDASNASHFVANGIDGILGCAFANRYYWYDSRDDGYYPTLAATLETSVADPWSFKLYPFNVTRQAQAQVSLSKLNAIADSAYAVTLEFLWPDSMAAPTRSRVFMQVVYIDTSGNQVFQTTRLDANTAVDTSTEAWSAVTYGPANFSKRKLSLTTGSQVKKDTAVLVTFFCSEKSVTSSDVIFIDPDPKMLAV